MLMVKRVESVESRQEMSKCWHVLAVAGEFCRLLMSPSFLNYRLKTESPKEWTLDISL